MNLKNKLISIFSLVILAGLLSLVPGVNKSSQQAQVISSLKQESIIEQTQIKLKELGYYSGEINNKFNIKTRLALIKYQKDNNIRQTGKLDRETQKLLLGIDLYGEKRESSNIVTGVLGGGVFEEFDENLKIINEIYEYYIKKSDGSIEVIPEEFYDHGHDDKKVSTRRQNHKEDDRELDYSIFLEENLGKEISLNKETKEFTLLEKSNERDFIVRPGGPGYREGKAAVFLVTFEEANIGNINYNVQAQDQDPNGNILGGPPPNPPVRPAPEDVQSYLFDQDNGQFQKFYNEMSHGKVTYTGDVFGWYEMPGDGDDPEYHGNLGPCTIRNYAANSAQHTSFEGKLQNIIDHYNIDLSFYNTIIILTECDEYSSVGGYASVVPFNILGQEYHYVEIKGHPARFSFTGSSDYLSFPDYVGILNHEIGHTFGLPHSISLDCSIEIIRLGCIPVDYGNPFDRMGYPDGASIFNFRAQLLRGWIDENQILKINQSGSYYIDNLQTENGIVGAYINYPGTIKTIFSVEHRKGDGFDSRLSTYSPLFDDVLNGLILYKNFSIDQYSNTLFSELFNPGNPSLTKFMIIDPNPTQDSIYDDLKYDAITGNFLDPKTGIEINVTNVTPDGIYFDVNYNLQTSECNYDIPINQIFSLMSVNQVSINLIGSFSNGSECLPKAYRISATDSLSENLLPSPVTKIVNPGGNQSGYSVNLNYADLFSYLNPGDPFLLSFQIEDLQTGEIQPLVYQDVLEFCGYDNDISQTINYSFDSQGLNIDAQFSDLFFCDDKSFRISATDSSSAQLFPPQTFSVEPDGSLYSNHYDFSLYNLYYNLNPGDLYTVNLQIEDLQTGEIQPLVYQGQVPQMCNLLQNINYDTSLFNVTNSIQNQYDIDNTVAQLNVPGANFVTFAANMTQCNISPIVLNFGNINLPPGFSYNLLNDSILVHEDSNIGQANVIFIIVASTSVLPGVYDISFDVTDLIGQSFNIQFQVEII